MYHSKIWHPYTKHSAIGDIPVIERGEGVHLHAADGTTFIDGISSWWCVNLGHAHPRVTEAIQAQAATLPHSILGNLSHPNAVELSAQLAALMPTPDRHVLYASDGASAIEAALKIAVQYFHNLRANDPSLPERNQFVALTDPYHGDTMGAVSVGYMESFHKPVKALTFPTHRIPTPVRRSVDDGASCRASLAVLDGLFERAEQEGTIAAVVLESLCQGASGMRMYCPGFLAAVAERCERHGALLVCDEIAMGFGRTGTMFAFEQAGIDPDIVCLGKGITNGSLPLSATVVKDRIYETFNDTSAPHNPNGEDRTFYHGHTFAGNPIAAAAALATLAVYREDNIMATVSERAAFLERELTARFADHPAVTEVRCLGMIGALQLDKTKEEMAAIRDRIRAAGVLLRPLGKCLYLMPPLVSSEATLVEIMDAMAAGLSAE